MLLFLLAVLSAINAAYWLENLQHHAAAPFNDADFVVFRNVKKQYGAKGDGVADDTDSIRKAVDNDCNRGCTSSKNPALVYFPPGTYKLSGSIIPGYYLEMFGDPNDIPVLKATADFEGTLIDFSGWNPTLKFNAEIRNFIVDTTACGGGDNIVAIDWTVSQATLLQNIVINLKPDSNQVGVTDGEGSGGFLCDLVVNGGGIGCRVGNQQFTYRNVTFNNCKTGIQLSWTWGWVIIGMKTNGCNLGLRMTGGIGSIELVDSVFTNTKVGVLTNWEEQSDPISQGSLHIENVDFTTTPIAVQHEGGDTFLEGGKVIETYVQGNTYDYDTAGNGGRVPRKRIHEEEKTRPKRPAVLLDSQGLYVGKSKPQYEDYTVDQVFPVKSFGAVGDARADDTEALQSVITATVGKGLVFVDHGAYLITSTIDIPADTYIVGEVWSLLLASGEFFAKENDPQPMLRVGKAGDVGIVQLSGLTVASHTPSPGAVFIEWNIHAPADNLAISGMWDVNARTGVTAGSDVGGGQIPDHTCLHITTTASCYMESNWWWLSDHGFDGGGGDVFSGRGVLVESQGPVWAYGPGPEHHVLYAWTCANAQNVFIGFLQIETPYFQPDPNALQPFRPNATWHDPTFADCNGNDRCIESWSLRVINSSHIFMYGGGFYSFFNNGQQRVCEVDDLSSDVWLYSVSAIGADEIVSWHTADGERAWADSGDNKANYPSTLIRFSKK